MTRKLHLTTKIFVGMLLGIVVGIVIKRLIPQHIELIDEYLFTLLGQIFIKLIRMLVVPLVLFSLILGVSGMGDIKKLGRIGLRTLVIYTLTTAIAITIGLFLGLFFNPGQGVDLHAEKLFIPQAPPSIGGVLVGIIPENPVKSMVEENMLQIIFFSLAIGLGLAQLKSKTEIVYQFILQGNELLLKIVQMIMRLAPYGTFALIASVTVNQGIDVLIPMFKYVITVLLALFLHAGLIYPLILMLFGKVNPIVFYKKMLGPMAVGFSTSSSTATLPVTIEVIEDKMGVSRQVAGFVLPLGATINMDGTALMQGCATIFIASLYNIHLTLPQLITVIFTATLASVGAAGVPGVGLVTLTMVLQSVGLPIDGVGFILGVDRILDMSRTATNLAGDGAVAVVIASMEKELDENTYYHFD